jgi:putative membrane protein
MWGDGFGWGLGGWMGPAVMGVTGLLVWVLLVAGAVALLRWSRTGQPKAQGPETPGAREVLDDRFARGDIDAEEYAARRRVLEGR